jgi:hypothetical protein
MESDLMERADVNCILCGSPERDLLIRQGEWTVYRYGACGLGFLDPHPDPCPYLQKARQWLKRDGVLVVDVPNYAGTDARKTWDRWKG